MKKFDSIVEAALAYADLGFRVIPVAGVKDNGTCTCGKLDCANVGKHPLISHWPRNGSIDPATIKYWFDRYPNANVGICTGRASDLVVLDSDGQKGSNSLIDLQMKFGRLPQTFRGSTGDGSHQYFRNHLYEIGNSTGKLGLGLDVRGEGGFVVAPPSRHRNGNRYEWRDTTALAPLPEWLAKLMMARESGKDSANHVGGGDIPQSTRNTTLFELACRLRKLRLSDKAIWDALTTENATRCKPPLEQKEVVSVFESSKKYGTNEGFAPADLVPDVVTLSNVDAEEVQFLWYPYVPLKKLTLLEGDPSSGKTFLALALCAAVTTGDFPQFNAIHAAVSQERMPPRDVLYLTAEDGVADTLRPRSDKTNADLTKFHVFKGLIDEKTGETQPFTLAQMPKLEAAVQEYRPALVVIDPIQGFLGAGVDFHRANEVRPILAALGSLAEAHSLSVLCIRHLSKASQPKAIYRGMGSIDFTAAARSVLLAGVEPTPPNRRAIVHLKSSLAKIGRSVEYKLDEGEFKWVGATDLSAADLFAPDTDKKQINRREEAKAFLAEALAGGERPSAEVDELALAEGYSQSTMKRARRDLGVISRQKGFRGPWFISLPKGFTEGQGSPRSATPPLWPPGPSVDEQEF